MSLSRGNIIFREIDLPSDWIEVSQHESPKISLNLFNLLSGKIITSVTYSSLSISTGAPVTLVMSGSEEIDGNYIKFNTLSGIQKDRYLLYVIIDTEDGCKYNIKKVIKIT